LNLSNLSNLFQKCNKKVNQRQANLQPLPALQSQELEPLLVLNQDDQAQLDQRTRIQKRASRKSY
jgi:hypothetical protein